MTSNEENTQGWRNQQSMIYGGRNEHGSARIDEHRMIIVGGRDEDGNFFPAATSTMRGPSSRRLSAMICQLPLLIAVLWLMMSMFI